MIIYWKTFEHCTGGKSTSILCRPSGSHHRHPQQRNSAQTFPPITQQPPPPVASFRSPFCLVFLVLRVHFSESILKSPLGSCRSTDLAWHLRAALLKELSQEGSYLAFFSPFPQILLKRTLTLHFDLQEHFCCTSVDLTSSSYFIHLPNQ